jgi:hypothetical protein
MVLVLILAHRVIFKESKNVTIFDGIGIKGHDIFCMTDYTACHGLHANDNCKIHTAI